MKLFLLLLYFFSSVFPSSISIISLDNSHCMKFCDIYFKIELSSSKSTSLFSQAKSGHRNVQWNDQFTFSDEIERLSIVFYSQQSDGGLEEGKNSEKIGGGSWKIEWIIEIRLEDLPDNESDHYIMLRNDEVGEFILPTCLRISFNKVFKDFGGRKIEFPKKIRGVRYCKEQFKDLFVSEEKDKKILRNKENIGVDMRNSSWLEEVNEKIENESYALVLKKYFLLLSEFQKNREFLLYYLFFLQRNDRQNDLLFVISKIKEEVLTLMGKRVKKREAIKFLNEIVDFSLIEKTLPIKINQKNIDPSTDNSTSKFSFNTRFHNKLTLPSSKKKNKASKKRTISRFSFNSKNSSLVEDQRIPKLSMISQKMLKEFIAGFFGYKTSQVIRNYSFAEECPEDFVCLMKEEIAMSLSELDILEENIICRENTICIKLSRKSGKFTRIIKKGNEILSKFQLNLFPGNFTPANPSPIPQNISAITSNPIPSSLPPPSTGLHLVILKRIPDFPKIFEELYNIELPTEIQRFLNDVESFHEKEIFILSTARNWSSLLSSKDILQFLYSIGSPILSPDRENIGKIDFILVGSRSLCAGEGLLQMRNSFQSVYMEVGLEGEKFGWEVPFVLGMKPEGMLKKNEIVSVFGYNFGREILDIGEVVIDKQVCDNIVLFPLLNPQRLDCRISVDSNKLDNVNFLQRVEIRLVSGLHTPLQKCIPKDKLELEIQLNNTTMDSKNFMLKKNNTQEIKPKILSPQKYFPIINHTSIILNNSSANDSLLNISSSRECDSLVNSQVIFPPKIPGKLSLQILSPNESHIHNPNESHIHNESKSPPPSKNFSWNLLINPPQKIPSRNSPSSLKISRREKQRFPSIVDFSPKSASFLGGIQICLEISAGIFLPEISSIFLPHPNSCLRKEIMTNPRRICCVLAKLFSPPKENPFKPCIYFKNNGKICSRESFTFQHEEIDEEIWGNDQERRRDWGRKRKFGRIRKALEGGKIAAMNNYIEENEYYQF